MATNCPKCSRPNQDDRAVCIYCGAPITLLSCPKCDRPNRKENQICAYCGTALATGSTEGEPAATAAGGVVSGAPTSCPSCSRPVQGHSLKCMYCGAEVVHAEAVVPGFVAEGRAVYRVICGECGGDFDWDERRVEKMIRARQMSCQECGGGLQMPQLLRDRFRAALMHQGAGSVHCPGCDRPIPPRGEEETLTCQYCALQCLPPTPGADHARMGPVDDGPLADVGLVQQNGAPLDASDQNRLLLQALMARAKAGEVLANEPAELVLAKYRLDHWDDPPSAPYLPLPEDDVINAVPAVLFGSSRWHVEQRGELNVVVITLEVGEVRADVSGGVKTVVKNVVGLGALVTLGVGFVSLPGSSDDNNHQTQIQHRIRMKLYPEAGGTRMAFSRQQDNDPPAPLDSKTTLRLVRQIYLIRPVWQAYYTLLAIYGPLARGMPALRVTGPGLSKRLQALGFEELEAGYQADQLLAELKPKGSGAV